MAAILTRPSFDVPGPPATLGGYGNIFRLMRDPIGEMGRLFRTYGPIAAVARRTTTRMISSRPVDPGTVIIHGPALIRAAVTQHELFENDSALGVLKPGPNPGPRQRPLSFWGAGLFVVNGDTHRHHRRLMLPAFHRKRVAAYCEQMGAITEQFLAGWGRGERRDIHHEMTDLTMRLAVRLLFGVDPAGVGRRIGHAIQESLQLTINPVTRALPLDLPGMGYRRLLNLAALIESEMRQIVAAKRASGAGDDVLSLLVQASYDDGSGLSEDDLVGHAELLFAAGHETSANALTWTLFLLSQHPRVLADLVDELEGELRGAAPSVEQLARLPLLDRVLKESLRLLPPVPWYTRIAAADAELGGHLLPAGTEVLLSTYHTHHMAEHYAEPERFDPDRWLRIEPDAFTYIPFSAGPRMCIGASFAQLEMKVVLALLLQRFRLALEPDARIDRHLTITMAPRHGMPMRLHAQDRSFHTGVGGVRGDIREMVALP